MGVDRWRAEAPANIALIKYMGKVPGGSQLPVNSSLSYTLNHLRSVVELVSHSGDKDIWQPLREEDIVESVLSEAGVERFLKHFDFLKSQLQIKGQFIISSGNTFPADCGLASSASSFAALTKVAHALALEQGLDREAVESLSQQEVSYLSQKGSGSSCRSFFSRWALWRDRGAVAVKLPYENLLHQVVLVEQSRKAVSSSEAHNRVVTSELFTGRPARAENRLQKLLTAMNAQNWREAHDLVWAEFWDMHALFETSQPPFGYFQQGSFKVLELVREVWLSKGDGPLVTMDAGANVHLLYRPDQGRLARWLGDELTSVAPVIESPDLRRETGYVG